MECVNLEDFLKNKGAFDGASVIKKNNEEVCIALNNEDELFKLIVPKATDSAPQNLEQKNGGKQNGNNK